VERLVAFFNEALVLALHVLWLCRIFHIKHFLGFVKLNDLLIKFNTRTLRRLLPAFRSVWLAKLLSIFPRRSSLAILCQLITFPLSLLRLRLHDFFERCSIIVVLTHMKLFFILSGCLEAWLHLLFLLTLFRLRLQALRRISRLEFSQRLLRCA
jgi:hypothetical protein